MRLHVLLMSQEKVWTKSIAGASLYLAFNVFKPIKGASMPLKSDPKRIGLPLRAWRALRVFSFFAFVSFFSSLIGANLANTDDGI